jgi:hypothetical protein
LTDTLFGSLDTQFVQPEGCADSSGLSKPSLTNLSPNMWADLSAKPKTPVYPGWIFDGEITQVNALNAQGICVFINPPAGSPEVKAAMQSIDWVSLDADFWLKHQGNPNVILRIAGKQRLGGDSVYFPNFRAQPFICITQVQRIPRWNFNFLGAPSQLHVFSFLRQQRRQLLPWYRG